MMRVRRHNRGSLSNQSGQTLILVLTVTVIAMLFLTGIASWATINIRAVSHTRNRELALMVAEAGTEYYRWHLAHAPQDFQDGTGQPGPYVHDYHDKDGSVIGTFTLDITAPTQGSTLVTIKSTGSPASNPNIQRAVETRLAKPSWAKYAVVANDVMRFGGGTEVFGEIHSNEGIRFDGLIHNIISSARTTYDDPDHSGGNEHAVHTHVSPVDPLPPASVPSRPDVFEAGRTFPVSTVDFDGITADLAQIKSDSQDDGYYVPASGQQGWRISFLSNDTFNLYRVRNVYSGWSNCGNALGEDYWGTWSIRRQDYWGNYPMPNNGLIFVEDHVWADGQIDGSRITIAAGRFPSNPSTYRHITINNDLEYTNYDGQDAIALIAQGNINVGLGSENYLKIDAALISQNGRVGRHYYEWGCNPYNVRQQIDLYGMIGTNQRYGFAWTDGTGYQIRNLNYDAELLYSPPPSFPLTSEQYVTLSWREVAP